MEIRKTQLQPNCYYHIYNRGINGASVFFETKNYDFFLQRFDQFVSPFVKTYAYCLLGNHFHILICIRAEKELKKVITKNFEKPLHWHISNSFASFFQSYTRALNKAYRRRGAIFETPFKRIEVKDDAYFSRLISYIHTNPEKHRVVKDFRDYPHSSYHTHLLEQQTKLYRRQVIDWFGGRQAYQDFHKNEIKIELTQELILE